MQFVSAGGGHGHGHGHHGHGGNSQCYQAQQFFNQWWPQSVLTSVFPTLCSRVGVTQAWATLQGLLGVPVTGTLDQATFQALLNNNNHAILAQQLLGGVITP